jgi:microcystin-dependent protein
MSDPFLAEIRIVASNFAPSGWAFCNGQLMSIQQNAALFSLLGTNYGGNGTTTFGLPNLQGTAPLHPGQGIGLSARSLGVSGGEASVTMDVSHVPSHTHFANIAQSTGTNSSPANAAWGNTAGRRSGQAYNSDISELHAMSNSAIDYVGSGSAHNNMQPFLAVNFIIAIQGFFPSSS